LETGNWSDLVRELMENYYDPLYRHTLPERRIEIDLEPENTLMERLHSAIADVLDQSKVV
jgi:tRNA 2-selenouridine synthase